MSKGRLSPFIAEKRPQLEELCRRFGVQRLEIFGSAARGHFDPSTSDLDFLVTFQEMEPGRYAEAYFGLLEGLQDLFGRPVDLVVVSAVRNPFFLREIESTRTLLYAA